MRAPFLGAGRTSDEPARGRALMRLATLAVILTSVVALAGCGGGGSKRAGGSPQAFDAGNVKDAVPRVEPRSKYGNPRSYVVFGKRYHTRDSSKGFVERGLASWYGKKFHGRKTSSGERYNMYAMTAAHKSLPLPTYVKVTNLDNGRSTVVRVNDRGPFHGGRVIDLSYAAATKLGVVRHGTARVEVRAIDPSRKRADPGFIVADSDWSSPTPTLADSGGGSRRSASIQRTSARKTSASSGTRARTDRAVNAALAATGARKVAPAPRRSATESAGGRGLYLQVGAFGDPKNAERLRQRLVAQLSDEAGVHSSASSGSRTLYKVRVGPFRSEHEASRMSAKLIDLGVDRPNRVWN